MTLQTLRKTLSPSKNANMPKIHSQQPTMLAYRTEDGTIKYTSATTSCTSYQTNYDSDGEPLIASSARSDVDTIALQRFTATGRPLQPFKPTGIERIAMGESMYAPPLLLPKQYTDDSIIPAIITDVIATSCVEEGKKRRNSLVTLLKGDRTLEKQNGKMTKVVFMPRREYLKHFARDQKGIYCGSEPWRQWTEAELDEAFAGYRPPKLERNVGRVFFASLEGVR